LNVSEYLNLLFEKVRQKGEERIQNTKDINYLLHKKLNSNSENDASKFNYRKSIEDQLEFFDYKLTTSGPGIVINYIINYSGLILHLA